MASTPPSIVYLGNYPVYPSQASPSYDSHSGNEYSHSDSHSDLIPDTGTDTDTDTYSNPDLHLPFRPSPPISPPHHLDHHPPKYPILYLYDGDTALALAIRQFFLERGGVRVRSGFLDVEPKDQILPSVVHESDYAGEVPVLFLGRPTRRPVVKVVGFGPITEYVDGVAIGGRKLYGDTVQEMAVIRTRIYCLDRDVVHPLYDWNNNHPGNVSGGEVTGLVPVGERQEGLRRRVLEGLDQVERDLEVQEQVQERGVEEAEKGYLLGKFSAADVYFFALVVAHVDRWDWVFDDERRPRVTEYFNRVRRRPMTGLAEEIWDTETTTVVEEGERWGYI